MPKRDASRIAAILAFSLAACGDAAAQVLYKWIDADGKTQYGDRMPKNPSGPVTRIEPDEQPAPQLVPKPAAKALQRTDESVAPANDAAAQRRETRRKLEATLVAARAKLASTKAALEGAASPQDDERQVIQQKFEKGNPAGAGSASTGGMLGTGGMYGAAARSNCRTVKGADGKTITTCPTMVPNEAFYERVNGLEEALKAAEEELAAAEQAYRRGTD